MYLIYDAIVLAILAFALWRGWHKGLLLSLCGLAVVVVSFLCAGFLADTLDDPLADALTPQFTERIEERFNSAAQQDPSAPPQSLADTLREMGGLYAVAADTLDDAADAVGDEVHAAATYAAHAVASSIVYIIVFALAFLLLVILLTLLLRGLDLVAKLPGLHFCNQLGGGVIGLVKGVIILYVVIACLRLFSGLITPEVEENTVILKFFLRFDPFSFLS